MKHGKNGVGRRVNPKKWATVAAAGFVAVQPVLMPQFIPTAAHAAQSGEAGEAGEGGIELSEGPAVFLTQLGYFEGAYRIAETLYLEGNHEAARAHLAESHHAFYEDIEDALTKYHADGFAREAKAFVQTIAEDRAPEQVRVASAALKAALEKTAQAAEATAYDRLMSIRELVALAGSEYVGGVEDGQVELAIEYRDSWGFLEVAKARAEVLTQAEDAALAQAGRDILDQLNGSEALYPGLTATATAHEAGMLQVAAGWIEIIALRQK